MSRSLKITITVPLPDGYFAESRVAAKLEGPIEDLKSLITEQFGIEATVSEPEVGEPKPPRKKRTPRAPVPLEASNGADVAQTAPAGRRGRRDQTVAAD